MSDQQKKKKWGEYHENFLSGREKWYKMKKFSYRDNECKSPYPQRSEATHMNKLSPETHAEDGQNSFQEQFSQTGIIQSAGKVKQTWLEKSLSSVCAPGYYGWGCLLRGRLAERDKIKD